jgi:glycine/D-amino acid oxidase-like deaminating enzyme
MGHVMKLKVLVVGAGVMGCAIAHELTMRGAAVTVVDSASVAAGVSSSTFSWVNSNAKTPDTYARLNSLGIRAHERIQRAAAVIKGPWFHQVGNIQVATSESDMAAIEQKVRRLTAIDYEASLLSRRGLRELEPAMEARGLVGGALYPKEGWVDTVSMCTALLHTAQTHGAVFQPYQRVADVAPGQVICVSADGSVHRYTPDVTVLAAGNGNRHILESSGFDFPLLDAVPSDHLTSTYSAVGLVATTGPLDSGITRMVQAPGIAMSPARNGGITLTDAGVGARWFGDPCVWEAPGVLLERARLLIPSLKSAEIHTLTASTRVLPRDGLTIADWVDSTQTLYAVATHSGVTLAPHLAEAVSDELLTGRRHQSLAAFGLDRFAS